MGKDAVSNQYESEQIGAENWKNEQIVDQSKQEVSPFPYQGMGEPQKDLQSGFQRGSDVDALELRPEGFHGDKWNNDSNIMSDRLDAPLLGDSNAGEFHEDKWKDNSALPPTHLGELNKPSDLSSSRFDGMTAEGNTVMPQSVNLLDGRSVVQIHDGRDATAFKEEKTEETLPLKDQIAQGVHAGDPLSLDNLFHKDKAGKKDKKDKKDKTDKKLKKEQDAALRDADPLFKEADFYDKDAYLAKDLKNSPDAMEDQGAKGKLKEGAEMLKEKLGMKKDEELKVLDTEAHPKGHEIATIPIPGIEARDQAAKDVVNQQAKAKKELNAELKEHAGHSDHITPSEILAHDAPSDVSTHLPMPAASTIADPLVHEQVVSKAEVNAEIREHGEDLGSSEQIRPSEIAGTSGFTQSLHGLPSSQDHLPAERIAGFEGTQDPVMQEHIQAKQDLNEEFMKLKPFENKDLTHGGNMESSFGINQTFENKNLDKSFGSENLSGSFGIDQSHDSLTSSNLAGETMGHGIHQSGDKDLTHGIHMRTNELFGKEDLNQGSSVSDNLSGGNSFGTNQTFENKDFTHDSLASNNLSGNIGTEFETNQITGNKDFTQTALASEGLDANNDQILKDHMQAKKELNAEIKDLATHSDHIVPSEIADTHSGHTEIAGGFDANDQITKDLATGSDQILPSEIADTHSGHTEIAGGFDANDQITKDHLQAKKEVNAEIKDLATGSDQILPSEIAPGLNTSNDQFMQDSLQAKKAVNAEIKDLATHSDHIVPSDLATHSDHIVPSEIATGDLVANNDQIIKDQVQAKKEVNAEIQDLSTHSDRVMPSEISTVKTEEPHQLSTTEKIKETVSAAAQAVKDTFKLH